MRADQLLVERGLAASRAQAQRLIGAGVQWRVGAGTAWQRVVKNSEMLPMPAELQLLDAAETSYVSRGGLKLAGALLGSGVVAAGRLCLDVGQSTGGFTDCLLRHGAAKVVGVDVGHGQLHASLRHNPQVVCVERINARTLSAADLGADGAMPGFDVIVGDLSFISLTLVLPALVPLLEDVSGDLLMLVKPQFELQPGQVGKGGLVKDPALYAQVEQRIRASCQELGLQVRGWYASAITGGDGNREFFIHATKS
ncbi:MAG TPA: TlyA family RNA methyltransferase [Burkholderiaceae bacterium]|nr:TlyA family RNA methyltransferase [Burkholderiaceae bacterium]